MVFLRFYERRNKFRYQPEQNLEDKNKMKRELSSCVIQKFNGYELLRNNLSSSEKKKIIPLDIVYEPTLDNNKKTECFSAPNISLAYVGYIEKMRNNQKYMESRITRQCRYCNNYFVKSEKKMKEHLACCSGKAGFTFSFDNGNVIDYRDHFSNLGDLPFAIYFDLETTTGNVVFFDAKMYVVSYNIVAAFHSDLSLPRINIFRSYDQSFSSLMSLAHFYVLDFNFFDDQEIYSKKTLKHLKAAVLWVNQKEKNTALVEMFSV